MRRVGTDQFEPIRIGFGWYGLIRENMTLMLTPHTHERPIHQKRTHWVGGTRSGSPIREKRTTKMGALHLRRPIHQNRTLWGQVCRATR